MSVLRNLEGLVATSGRHFVCGETSAKSRNAGYTEDLNLEDTPTERCAFAIENIL
jgi:hypothetical protein